MLQIFVDADGCPVKDEIYKVAKRYNLSVTLVANTPLNIPLDPKVNLKVVPGNFDAADDWIVENIGNNDIAITGDILLADRCIKKNAKVIGHKGNEFTPDNIGAVVASRELLIHLRQTGEAKGGPSGMIPKDRSNFLSKLDQVIQKLRVGVTQVKI
jgi:uncharacterized protein YaiI (UPF0178 family)